MGCNTCKKKQKPITTLSSDVNMEELKQAHEYLLIASKMNDDKWDLVEKVYNDLYPQRFRLNRGCKDCLNKVARVIHHEYKKRS